MVGEKLGVRVRLRSDIGNKLPMSLVSGSYAQATQQALPQIPIFVRQVGGHVTYRQSNLKRG